MRERKKIREYRKTLHEMATPLEAERRKALEGKAAKLGVEISAEEKKGKPKVKLKPKR